MDDPEPWQAWGERISALDLDYFLIVDVDQDYEFWSGEAIRGLTNMKFASQGPSNRGLPTGFDVNQDGYLDAEDAQGFGAFHGQHSMLVLSQKAPKRIISFNKQKLMDFSPMPVKNGESYYSSDLWKSLLLSPTGLWQHDFGNFQLLSAYAQAPAFDGEEQRNVLRNAAEIRWWNAYISGKIFFDDASKGQQLAKPFILMGTLNLDPKHGKGNHQAILDLLSNPKIRTIPFHEEATVDRNEQGLGFLRVDYILPSCHFEIVNFNQIEMSGDHKMLIAELSLNNNCI